MFSLSWDGAPRSQTPDSDLNNGLFVIYIYIYIYVYICVYIVYVYVCVYTYIHKCVYIYIYIYMHIYTHMCLFVCLFVILCLFVCLLLTFYSSCLLSLCLLCLVSFVLTKIGSGQNRFIPFIAGAGWTGTLWNRLRPQDSPGAGPREAQIWCWKLRGTVSSPNLICYAMLCYAMLWYAMLCYNYHVVLHCLNLKHARRGAQIPEPWLTLTYACPVKVQSFDPFFPVWHFPHWL